MNIILSLTIPLILMTNFMVTEGARLRRMTRGKSSLQDRDIFFEQLKRMSDFGFGERTRPRMGKRGITFFWNPGGLVFHLWILLWIFISSEEETILAAEETKRMGDFAFAERTRPRMGKRMENDVENIFHDYL